MNTARDVERAIELLSPDEFEKLAAWVEQRRKQNAPQSSQDPTVFRDHSSFLNNYVPEDEGLYPYDDPATR